MLRFQLQVAVALAIAAVGSVGFLAFYGVGNKEGQIKLPVYSDEQEDGTPDPFNVTKPEDAIDGYPVNEQEFWHRMRLRKLLLSVNLAIILAIEAVGLGYAVTAGTSQDVLISTLHVLFALYCSILAAFSVNKDSMSSHSTLILHLAVLTTLATAFLGTTAILPSYPPPAGSFSLSDYSGLGLWYAALVLYIASCVNTMTTPWGPNLHYPPEHIYSEKVVEAITSRYEDNVCGVVGASIWDTLLFSYTTKVVMLGNVSESLDIGDLPIVPADMRAVNLFARMRATLRAVKLRIGKWTPKPGSGWELGYRLLRVNAGPLALQISLAAISACLFYAPAYFLRKLVNYLEVDPERQNRGWGFAYCAGLSFVTAILYIMTGQLWSISTTTLQVSIRVQLNSILFAKTLVRKDVVSSSGSSPSEDSDTKKKADPSRDGDDGAGQKQGEEEAEFSSKAQVMTLMTTDVDRVSELALHLFTLVDSPVEIVIGTLFLYNLLGVSCFVGLAVTCLFLPMNHFAGKIVVNAQDNIMKTRDERVALMNEILGAIRMLKFMAWERSFEERVMKIRAKELKYQKLNYTIETLFNAIWNGSPILVTLVSFWHFAVIRQQTLTPSIAFTSVVLSELKFALNALPETLISLLQSAVSLRRIENYLNGAEVSSVPPLETENYAIALQSASVTWPQDRSRSSNCRVSIVSTPKQKFVLSNLSMNFPVGELSLICGKLGSGKTLLLLSLLGEADVVTGQLHSPRSPPDAIASFTGVVPRDEDWTVPGVCAYVPQSAWLRNASIKENILFGLPYVEERYQKTLEVCALVSDLKILEDGDEAEIGERGVNLSGGQKARVSLARAVYSRASILLLDDVLSAVDAHTAHHLYHECLTGELMRGRTVILVSHHVQLCAPGASFIVTLDNGRVLYQGNYEDFRTSGALSTLVQSNTAAPSEDKEEAAVATIEEEIEEKHAQSRFLTELTSETSSMAATNTESEGKVAKKKSPRKLVEEEKRAVGRIGRNIWATYAKACGDHWYWILFCLALLLATVSPVFENSWLQIWSGTAQSGDARSPVFYISVYAAVTAAGLVLTTVRWFVLYHGSVRASTILYKRLLEAVLFADIRFHDTVSRGRLLNRFGKDFESIDSSLPDNLGHSIMHGLNVLATLITLSVVGGVPFLVSVIILGLVYYSVAKVYSQTSRDMRRLDSVTRSPLYSIYGETISGVAIIRAFGASSKFLRDMLRCVDTNTTPYYWMSGVNRWLLARYNLLSSAVVGITALVAILTPRIDASLAGFMLAFASTVTTDLLHLVIRFVRVEQSMVALERVKEYSELPCEPPEFIEPRPPQSWPSAGEIKVDNLVIRYAPDLPNVLHNLKFEIQPGEKIGILGRTGSGKSTLALSFFRFVEATEGQILIDNLDISQIGLSDLRSRLTIIPQDPTILSGTLRSTLDVSGQYDDTQIYEALRRVHLIPSSDTKDIESVNVNVFCDLDSPVSEGGENFSTGEKQLLCMARAILKQTKVLLMDEATASVDYATDELISKTIRHEFTNGTILTIAHRLRTVIDYDRVMLLEEGHIVEFDTPSTLLSDLSSKFYALCKATGKDEFAMLNKLAGL
ncbi:multidrug resistance-associated ABC transporter [Gloeophyllum trabeum ATCC 11539]|uniref:Multidrug resistance-associated ABC transporter n=1 Tax=Gloeophyllum trabeum (strain ATCC 11539 / FP-39264 / Madison 617) TaxID=670483 RepID=S7RDP4_GLOTA|nr:multidrug resistance-associated ABC transporter [Gloeophyllum trabeum ATCC 11539]EPQ52340.1 multidrug resistance-associated ABC transporter [Gloeophyllum trabeum ATCC 11539]